MSNFFGMGFPTYKNQPFLWENSFSQKIEEITLGQGVPNLAAESGVSGRTRLLLGTLAHALVVLHSWLWDRIHASTLEVRARACVRGGGAFAQYSPTRVRSHY